MLRRLLTLAALPGMLAAQSYAPRDSVTVVPGAQFRAGGLHRLFFGSRYRDLWTTPIRVPVLDLHRFAGGLTPKARGGGQQTKSLRLTGGDGKEYAFRSVAKDPTRTLPPELRETFAANLLRDQMSSGHPVGAIVVAPLLDAAGVLHATPMLVQMPDDPALGEYRAEFAGLLGTIEERPKELDDETATFAGASDIVGSDELFKKLDDEPSEGVDARSFLAARLTDVFLGDWDRHRDQWRWALVGEKGQRRWLPIPRDRDQAFVRFDGFLLDQVRRTVFQLVEFGPRYPKIIGATWNGRDLDRRFLAGLERPVWDSVAKALQARFTDGVIADAARHLPPEYYPIDGPRLEAALRARRDRLPDMADKYYRLLAGDAEVYGSDKVDTARVVRKGGGETEVTLTHRSDTYFRRVFHPDETGEIRIHLQGGGDQLVVEGSGGGPLVRAIGGGGDDRYLVRNGSGIHLYDDRGENSADGSGINRKPWRWKPDSLKPNELPPRDWGNRTLLMASALYGPDVQVLLGYSGHTDWYGFRREPYSTRLTYGLEFSTGQTAFRARLGLTRQFESSRAFLALDAMGSGFETLRWYGFGNETAPGPSVDYNKVSQTELVGGIRIGTRFGKRNWIAVGPEVRWSNTDLGSGKNATRFISTDAPFGSGHFGIAGGRLELVLDGRDIPKFATRGGSLVLRASGYPALWDASEAIGRVEAEGSFTLAPRGSWQPSLNVMAGGAKTWGDLPFFLAPKLGGSHTLRGYRPDRFAGDASLYGSAEARLPLTRIKLVVPGQQGVFGFGDVGRVYLRGEASDRWHSTLGGGIWLSFLGRGNVLYAGAGKPTRKDADEGWRIFAGFGFPY